MVDRPTAGSSLAITNALKAEGVRWWHWFQSTWLIVDRYDRGDAAWWRDTLRQAAPATHLIVIDADGGNWAAFGIRKRFDWLHAEWSDPWRIDGPADE